MPSSDRPLLTPRLFAAALLLSSALQIGESLLPRLPIFPWLRLGLSWAILLPYLLSFGTWPTFALFLLRNVLALVCGGQAASSFLLSGVSGAASILILGPLSRRLVIRGWIGWAGAGALLATGFNLTQLFTAADLLVGHAGLLSQIGPLLAWSGISGGAVGLLAFRFWRHRCWESLSQGLPERAEGTLPGRSRPWLATLCLSLLILAFNVTRLDLSLAILLLSAAIGRQHLRNLKGAWPFFLWLAWFHLPAPGHVILGLPLTREGLEGFALHALRLLTFLLAGQELGRTLPWARLTKGQAVWAKGLALALPSAVCLFPAAMEAARGWRTETPWEERFWNALHTRLQLRNSPS